VPHPSYASLKAAAISVIFFDSANIILGSTKQYLQPSK
jgi:hypothetical protein